MRINKTSVSALIFLIFLAGCFGDGGSSTTAYNGTWQVSFTSTVAPIAVNATAGESLSCSAVPGTITTSNTNSSTYSAGSGTITQNCTITTTIPGYATSSGVVPTSVTSVATAPITYLVSVSINLGTNVMNAQINGVPLTGTCISTLGCSAQGGGMTLGITR